MRNTAWFIPYCLLVFAWLLSCSVPDDEVAQQPSDEVAQPEVRTTAKCSTDWECELFDRRERVAL